MATCHYAFARGITRAVCARPCGCCTCTASRVLQLDTEEMTVENAITRSWDKVVQLHLDPVWHQLSGKTRQLISDVRTLRTMLE